MGAANYTSDARWGWVDMAAAKRSPGSTLKPLIYGLGFDLGLIDPRTMMQDRPQSFSGYSPANFDGTFRGPVRASEALTLSLNVPAIALTEAVGPARLLARLRQAGADPKMPGDAAPGLAIALGGLGLSLEELTQLYGAVAQGGTPLPLHMTMGTDAPLPGPSILSPRAAGLLSGILAEAAPPTHGVRGRVAHKTGTSYGHRDAWAMGFTGRIVAGAWVGRADSTAVPGLSGADHAAPLLFEALGRADPQGTPLDSLIRRPTGPLPAHLRRFDRGVTPDPDAPDLAFPREGTVIALEGGLALKVLRGTPPFTWIVNGTPQIQAARRRAVQTDDLPPGPARISVIDALGRQDSVTVTLER